MAIRKKPLKVSENKTTKVEAQVVPPNEADFNGQQLDLFRTFLCNTDSERNQLSNTLDLWDSVPRYAVSRQQMDKIRKEKGFLDLQK